MSERDVARVKNCGLEGASLWLTVLPLERDLQLTNPEMSAALRHQYGLSVKPNTVYCRCGSAMGPGHAHTCLSVLGPSTYSRHESIVSELCLITEAVCRAQAVRAPPLQLSEAGKAMNRTKKGKNQFAVVPDVLMDGANLSLATDVTMIYGEADSYLPDKLSKALFNREARKVNTYEKECARRDIEFQAFVMESHGYLHESAERVLTTLAKYMADQFGRREVDTLGYFKRRVAIALQRGNAKLDCTAIRKSWGSYGAKNAMGLIPNARGSVSI